MGSTSNEASGKEDPFFIDIEALLEAPFIKYYQKKEYKDERDRHDTRRSSTGSKRRDYSRSPERRSSRHSRSRSPVKLETKVIQVVEKAHLTEAQRDRRTVFCRQLAQRLESRQLKEFCEVIGPVTDVRIVYDKISRRSKGVAYVEFLEEESVPAAVALTGKKLLGIPIIVELTETEKNRLAEEAAAAMRQERIQMKIATVILRVSNLHSSIGEAELRKVLQPFGDLRNINIKGDGSARVEFRHGSDAKQASEKLNGFELAGRGIRIEILDEINEKNSSTNTGGNEEEYSNNGFATSSDRLLRLARESSIPTTSSTCIILRYMYDPVEEKAPDWHLSIAEEVREECSNYGAVERVHVARTANGEVFVKFEREASAQAAITSLAGRWFGGRQIEAFFSPEE